MTEDEPVWRSVKQHPPRQDSLADQLNDLYMLTHRFGLYDAAERVAILDDATEVTP